MTAVLRISGTFLVFAGSILAQHLGLRFDFGVKGGASFTDVLQSAGVNLGAPFSRTSEYLIGPVAELRIPFGLAIEVDAIYHGAQYHVATIPPFTANGSAWEIPYVAKFRFPIPLVKSFVSAGGVHRSFTNSNNGSFAPTSNGVVVAGGVELRISKLRLSGELRWLHWGRTDVESPPAQLVQNQGQILFGLVF